ncbi:hypothetical protein D082_16660 [Synechocystis sp. PCC 6714]|nr:hypothetical protein D082_16660 [Synechocystis sp. PCC 6714]
MFPVAITIATVAMASGVEGATFFTPLLIIGLRLPVDVAVATGLITEVFGFSSGVYAYFRRGLIDYRLGRMLLMVTIPLALFGTWVGQFIPDIFLRGILALGLLAIAIGFLWPVHGGEPKGLENEMVSLNENSFTLTAKSGEIFHYHIPDPSQGQLLAAIGALFLGMVSTGLGEMNGYFLIQRCRIPNAVAVATSVFTVAITALAASVGHAVKFIQAGDDSWSLVLSIVVFTAPGVVIGGQLGSWVARKLPQAIWEKGMGILFTLVGLIFLGEILLEQRAILVSFFLG